MELDLDTGIGQALPWDLWLGIGGTRYPTLPPTVGQLVLLEKFPTLKLEAGRDLVASVFRGDRRPPIDSLPAEGLMVIVAAYSGYFQEHVRKNSKAIAAAVAAAMGKAAAAAGPSVGASSSSPS